MGNITSDNYRQWLIEVKTKITSSQIKAAIKVNVALIEFYWDLGRMIVEKQKETKWGSKLLEQLSIDLKKEFPSISGFSRTNLYYVKQFYVYFSNPNVSDLIVSQLANSAKKTIIPQVGGQIENVIIPQFVGQLPWGHIKLLISKVKNEEACLFYMQKTITNSWSRDVLGIQIKSNLFARQGAAISNFESTLPKPQSDLAHQTLKNPYVFDFLNLKESFKEKDIEDQLVQHVTKFLLELGKGFAYLGKQYHLEVGGSDYYMDLLFYHLKLRCYVVVELKNTKFIPEYAGKLNFYLSAVDSLLATADDNASIGILLCRSNNQIETEFALRGIKKPIGVSEFQFTEIIPEELKSSLPTIEEIENELKN